MKKTDLKDVLEQTEKIEDKVDLLLKEEKIIEGEVKEVKKDESVLVHVEHHRRGFVKKLAKHKFIFSLIVSLGVVLVWRGLWDITAELPVLKESGVALVLGLAIVWFLEKYSEVE